MGTEKASERVKSCANVGHVQAFQRGKYRMERTSVWRPGYEAQPRSDLPCDLDSALFPPWASASSFVKWNIGLDWWFPSIKGAMAPSWYLYFLKLQIKDLWKQLPFERAWCPGLCRWLVGGHAGSAGLSPACSPPSPTRAGRRQDLLEWLLPWDSGHVEHRIQNFEHQVKNWKQPLTTVDAVVRF